MFFGLLDLPEQAGSVCREDAAAPAPVQAQLSPAGASGKPFWGSAPVFHGNRHAETCSTAAIHIHFNVYLFSVHVGGGGKAFGTSGTGIVGETKGCSTRGAVSVGIQSKSDPNSCHGRSTEIMAPRSCCYSAAVPVTSYRP